MDGGGYQSELGRRVLMNGRLMDVQRNGSHSSFVKFGSSAEPDFQRRCLTEMIQMADLARIWRRTTDLRHSAALDAIVSGRCHVSVG